MAGVFQQLPGLIISEFKERGVMFEHHGAILQRFPANRKASGLPGKGGQAKTWACQY
jgi:hypothetical protein